MSSSHVESTSLPPYYYVDPYNYEFLTPISFSPSTKLPSSTEKTSVSSRSKPKNPFSKLFSFRSRQTNMTDLFGSSEKYAGYEKANDVEASDAASSSEADSTTSSTTRAAKVDARVISDAIIGLSDGMTVPFALTAGLSAIGDTRMVIFGGFAELCAGAISMGLGGYLGAKSEEESYRATMMQTESETKLDPSSTSEKISQIFSEYGVPQDVIQSLAAHISSSPKISDFLMRFEHGVSEPASSRAITCALTIALAYFVGGFIPLLPYLLVARDEIEKALVASVVTMVFALFAFGYGKTCFVTGWKGRGNMLAGIRGGGQMVVVGGLAAGCAMGLVKLFDSFL